MHVPPDRSVPSLGLAGVVSTPVSCPSLPISPPINIGMSNNYPTGERTGAPERKIGQCEGEQGEHGLSQLRLFPARWEPARTRLGIARRPLGATSGTLRIGMWRRSRANTEGLKTGGTKKKMFAQFYRTSAVPYQGIIAQSTAIILYPYHGMAFRGSK